MTNSALNLPIQAALRRLVEAEFTARDAICVYRTIYCYAVGFTIEEQAVYPRPGKRDPRYGLKRRAARMIPAEQFPRTLAAGEEMFDSTGNSIKVCSSSCAACTRRAGVLRLFGEPC